MARMVFNPMHVDSKRARLMPNFFGHVFTKGLSVQRVEMSTVQEQYELVASFLSGTSAKDKSERAWLGYIEANVGALRDLMVDAPPVRAYRVYDSGEPTNPAHTEIGTAREIPEADRGEYRRLLLGAFGEGAISNRRQLLSGAVWNRLSEDHRSRAVPPQWRDLE